MMAGGMEYMKRMLAQSFEKSKKRVVWTVKGKRHSVPDFLIIGAARAGTTSLYSYLVEHPQILRAKVKEVQFFSTRYSNGIMWYRAQFPRKSVIDRGFITGEASPYYLFHPHAPKRMHEVLPNSKLIVLLRDPVDRTISHYCHEVSEKSELLSIEEALENEERRIEPELMRMQSDEFYNSEIYRRYSYKKRGIYVDQLVKYLQYFDNARLLIVKSEDLFCDPKNTLRDVFRFLDVDPKVLPSDLTRKNMGSYTNKVSAGIYKELVNYFAPHNIRLYRLLGRDFGWKRR